MAHERGVALGIGELVRVQVAHGADDRLSQLILVERDVLQKLHGSVVVGDGLQEIGIAVGKVAEHAAVAVKIGEPSVGTAGHAHAVPEPGGAEELVDDVRRAVELVPRFVQVGAFAHVVDLGGHGDELVDGREDEVLAPRLGGGAGTLRRERVEERLHRPRRRLQGFRVGGEVRHRPGAGHHGGADLLEVGDDAVPVAVDPLREGFEVFELREAAELLADVPGDGVHGVEPASRYGVAAGLDPRFHRRAGLEHELLEDLLVVELSVEHHLGHEVVELAGLGAGGLAPEHEVGGDVIRAADGGGERGEGETAGGGAHELVKVDEGSLGGTHALHGAAPQGHEGHQVHGDGVKIHEVLGVEDVVGEDIVGEHGGGTDGGHVRGDGLGLLGDIGDVERGDARERLGGIRCLLEPLELLRVGDNLLDLLGGETRAVGGNLGLLLVVLDLTELLVGVELDGHLVGVVDEHLLDERREDILLGHPRLEPGQRLLEPENLHGIALVQPRGERAKHEGEAAREATGVVLAHGKLDGVDGRVDGRLGEPLLGNLGDRLGDERLNLGNVLLGHALEADRESGLPELVLETVTHDGLAETGLLERHPERRRG
mmetsp:Transcript_11241/g.45349  ORF Transcript_11241/g.45349 Transcript_11241/m.45349 type:complete len:601 (-) Transcript_11241:1349-3151(-)